MCEKCDRGKDYAAQFADAVERAENDPCVLMAAELSLSEGLRRASGSTKDEWIRVHRDFMDGTEVVVH